METINNIKSDHNSHLHVYVFETTITNIDYMNG